MRSAAAREDVERRLRATFRSKSDTMVVRPIPFDGVEDPSISPVVVSADSPRRRLRTLVAVAATLILVAVGIRVWSARSTDAPTSRNEVRTGPDHPAAPLPAQQVLTPTDVPKDLTLWSATPQPGAGGTAFTSSQLFGGVDASGALAPGVLIETQPASPGEVVRPGGPADAVVRGHTVTVDPAKDGGEGTQEFAWVEGDAEVRVTVRGATIARAVEILDALRPRGPSLRDGFDPASAPAGIRQLAEDARATTAPSVERFEYGRGPADSNAASDLVVTTTSGSAYPGFVRTWIAGTRRADGPSVAFDAAVGATAAWADGRQAVATSPSGSLSRATLERVAQSVAAKPVEPRPSSPAAATASAPPVRDRGTELPLRLVSTSDTEFLARTSQSTGTPIALQIPGAAPIVVAGTCMTIAAAPTGAGYQGACAPAAEAATRVVGAIDTGSAQSASSVGYASWLAVPSGASFVTFTYGDLLFWQRPVQGVSYFAVAGGAPTQGSTPIVLRAFGRSGDQLGEARLQPHQDPTGGWSW